VSLSSVPAPLYRDRFKQFMSLVVFAPSENVASSLAQSWRDSSHEDNTVSREPASPTEPIPALPRQTSQLVLHVDQCHRAFVSNVQKLNAHIAYAALYVAIPLATKLTTLNAGLLTTHTSLLRRGSLRKKGRTVHRNQPTTPRIA
jgi:hypothetical protein